MDQAYEILREQLKVFREKNKNVELKEGEKERFIKNEWLNDNFNKKILVI